MSNVLNLFAAPKAHEKASSRALSIFSALTRAKGDEDKRHAAVLDRLARELVTARADAGAEYTALGEALKVGDRLALELPEVDGATDQALTG